MARNEEKAQSMLYRFREAQAAELGLGTRSDRRPRMASACKSLRDCEKWRGEILREISRKVAKIQDAGLTDYEVRDLNDEINKLMREKRHWENQIVALGGANYRRNVAMLDDDGKEVPGTKGYKYFGRAKDLPGVKELFQSKKTEEEEESQAFSHYKKFMNQGPAYYGDLDENDDKLLAYEREAENEDWEEAYLNLREALGLSQSDSLPAVPRFGSLEMAQSTETELGVPQAKSKRKANSSSQDEDVEMEDSSKRPKTGSAIEPSAPSDKSIDAAYLHAQQAASYIPFLDTAHLMQPKMLTREETEDVLLQLRKKALVEEYFGDGEKAEP